MERGHSENAPDLNNGKEISMFSPDSSPSGQERRSSQRVPLDVPYFVTISPEDEKEEDVPALLIDLSLGGSQLGFSPATRGITNWLGHRVRLLGLPKEVCNRNGECAGAITWMSRERCGVRFETPLQLTDEQIMAILAEL
jgi:hypothetical protein